MFETRHLLIVGGGPAAIEAALAVRRLAGDRVRVTLLAASQAFAYRPTSVAEPFGLGVVQRFSLPDLASDVGLHFVEGTLERVDPEAHVAWTSGGPIPYDALL